MKGGRKNLRRACEEGTAVTLAEGESIMQVVTLRVSNLIEVTDGEGVKSLALFPAKFQTSFWIKNGNFVVVDASGRDEALESGSRNLLDGTRVVTDSLDLCYASPAIFKSTPNGWATGQEGTTSQAEEEHNSKEEDDDDDMPPLEANTNRNRPFAVHSDTESDSDS
ncbi:probable RNA-binding protein EIF1AD [Triticum dicoccoides]|uniref:probable RNA-binding protein EIF1AD n=1 Tax=Triticum dicoccoides TaxID=85692 RepID=UPI0018900943|nr:probable RNA-binding protein EIF1AD [Triticum dicoccoides]